jgi:hypothetical protein
MQTCEVGRPSTFTTVGGCSDLFAVHRGGIYITRDATSLRRMHEHAVSQLFCGVPTLHSVPQCQALLDKASR